MYGDNIRVNFDSLYRVDTNMYDNSEYLLKKGDILFVRSSLKREGAGWAALFDGFNEPVTFCGFIIRVRISQAKILPEFLTYYLRSHSARNKILMRAGQVAITNVTQENLKTLNIPIPSILEQNQIPFSLKLIGKFIRKNKQKYNSKE